MAAAGEGSSTRAALPEQLPSEAHVRLALGIPATVLPARTNAHGEAVLAWQDLLSQARCGHQTSLPATSGAGLCPVPQLVCSQVFMQTFILCRGLPVLDVERPHVPASLPLLWAGESAPILAGTCKRPEPQVGADCAVFSAALGSLDITQVPTGCCGHAIQMPGAGKCFQQMLSLFLQSTHHVHDSASELGRTYGAAGSSAKCLSDGQNTAKVLALRTLLQLLLLKVEFFLGQII